MSDRPELRIGDREREAAASALGDHYAAGRITREEYDERSAVVWAARTDSDLRPVFADLPGPHHGSARRSTPAPVRSSGRGPHGRAHHPRGGFRVPVLPVILVVLGFVLLTEGWPLLLLLAVLWWTVGHRRHSNGRPRPAAGSCS